jgi:hypothetical protein
LSVRDAAGTPNGTLTAIDANTQIQPANHIEHNFNGSGTNSWTVRWTSPATVVPVVVYASGLAANAQFDLAGDFFYTTTDGTLPVELVAFDAVADGRSALLSWRTESESDNVGFDVEHAVGPQSFSSIAFVPGAGTTNEPQDYRLAVDDLAPGKHRFRLKQIDVGGAFTYSSEVEVVLQLDARFELSPAYPNPFVTNATFDLVVDEDQNVRIGLYDLLGRRVAVVHDGPVPRLQTKTFYIDGSGLATGAYFIRAEGERFTASQVVSFVN